MLFRSIHGSSPPPPFNPNPEGFIPDPIINFAADELGIHVEDYMNYSSQIPSYPQPQMQPSQESNAQSSSAATSSSSSGSKRRRTALVWVEGHFEYRERVLEDGTKVQEAVCKWPGCIKVLSGASSSGTGHLDRHLKGHRAKRDQETRRRQGQLGFSADGQVSNFNYDADLSRQGLCNMVAEIGRAHV